ncbi:hypothetical protein L249_5075 [Ophiocordyceps polyrhachis-furcata BCC 54312]|uniref:Uncharacterized protein n=1 Tax=Ophiocordyceps polyrhachis-furcata BCC 54312 TaxID=1330021 RepID=A0A367L3F0_9HYPO|nr:hypothetical protein L249_5075 [Ophiocordyceps polyrhachis-furcata BCC 54312]
MRANRHRRLFAQDAQGQGQGEEAYDLSLLRAAAPIAYDEPPPPPPVVFDVTSALGPLATQDVDFIKKLQAHEANVRDADLLRQSTNRSKTSFRRRQTLREAGQHEANRRGRIVEVIAEQELEQQQHDISNFDGPSHARFHRRRRRRRPATTTRVFYPQPDWRPPSMGWPYLSLLVLVSVALAAGSEMMYHVHADRPLVRFTSAAELSTGLYVAVRFAPSICAVTYGVLWQLVDLDVRRLEAFHQLSRRAGAEAAASVNVDYLTGYTLLRPLCALRRRHYAVFVSSLAAIMAASLVPTLAAASIVLTPSRAERRADPAAWKMLLLSAIWSRLLTATLVACAVAGILLLRILQSRRSGLLADAQGIAGLASMAVVSHILMDFRRLDTASLGDIHRRLKRKRYVLRNSSLAPRDEVDRDDDDDDDDDDDYNHDSSSSDSSSSDSSSSDSSSGKPPSESPHPLILRPIGWLPFLAGSVALMAMMPAMLFTNADVILDRAPWAATAAAVGLKLSWNAMETAVRVMEPFYILSRRHAPAKTLLLDYTAQPFGWLPAKALLNQHWLMLAVGVGSLMMEFLTILVSGLATVDGQELAARNQAADTGQETPTTFYSSLALCEAVLVYAFVIGAVVFARRRSAFLPRQPTTMASVLAYVHQSKMLYHFVGTEAMGAPELGRRLDLLGKTYGLGWFTGRDGQTHCGVDEEELMGSYRHGVDDSQRNQPWNTAWDVF